MYFKSFIAIFFKKLYTFLITCSQIS